MIFLGDCRERMAQMDAASVDSVVTDPPYHLTDVARTFQEKAGSVDPRTGRERSNSRRRSGGFMGKAWDGGGIAHDPALWAEVLRVLKPGAHLLAFGGTRTFHRLTCAIEDAGFEIRDCLSWLYGSGFPKSLDVSKAIDKAAGAENVVGHKPDRWTGKGSSLNFSTDRAQAECKITAPATDAARKWDGCGTALKPAWEPIILARKPLTGTVAATVLEHGTGALNIDGCRIDGAPRTTHADGNRRTATDCPTLHEGLAVHGAWPGPTGRWPANVILSHTPECREIGTRKVKSNAQPPGEWTGETKVYGEGIAQKRSAGYGTETVPAFDCAPECPVRMLDEQSGERGQSGDLTGNEPSTPATNVYGKYGRHAFKARGDSGGASRFFYTAKASGVDRTERGAVKNGHPTVKPVDLMRWLCKLVTPPGGVVLDPFCGSGSTGVAAVAEGFRFIGIEKEPEYVEIARRRIENVAPLFGTESAP